MSAAHDTAHDGTLAALAMLFADLERDADSLRELLASAQPTALNEVACNLLALLAWRCDFGRKLAGGNLPPAATDEERFIRPEVLRRRDAA